MPLFFFIPKVAKNVKYVYRSSGGKNHSLKLALQVHF